MDFAGDKVRNPIYRKVVAGGAAVHAKYSNSCDSCRPRARQKHRIRLAGEQGALMRELPDVKFPLVYIIDSAFVRALWEDLRVFCVRNAGVYRSCHRCEFHCARCTDSYERNRTLAAEKYIGGETLLEISLTRRACARKELKNSVSWCEPMFMFLWCDPFGVKRNFEEAGGGKVGSWTWNYSNTGVCSFLAACSFSMYHLEPQNLSDSKSE